MQIDNFRGRLDGLWHPKRHEIISAAKPIAQEVIADASLRGMLQSSSNLLSLREVYVPLRRQFAVAAFDLFKSTHQAMGIVSTAEVRDFSHAWMSEAIRSGVNLCLVASNEHLRQWGAWMQNPAMIVELALEDNSAALTDEHGHLLDNFLDAAGQVPPNASGVTIHAQTIGTVMTGAGAVANISQNSGSRESLREALKVIRNELANCNVEQVPKRNELLEITDDAENELNKQSLNDTKLVLLFTVLAQTVQTLPNAGPAYLAIKGLLSAVGIML